MENPAAYEYAKASCERTLRWLERCKEEHDRLNSLPDKLKQAAVLRLENPEDTLSQLAELFDPPITKSALNHRLRKLIELAKEKV